MAMDAGEIERLIKAKFPDARSRSATWRGTATTTPRTSSAPSSRARSRVQQHQMVYEALGGRMGGVLHALALTTAAPCRPEAARAPCPGRRLTSPRQSTHCGEQRAGDAPAATRVRKGP